MRHKVCVQALGTTIQVFDLKFVHGYGEDANFYREGVLAEGRRAYMWRNQRQVARFRLVVKGKYVLESDLVGTGTKEWTLDELIALHEQGKLPKDKIAALVAIEENETYPSFGKRHGRTFISPIGVQVVSRARMVMESYSPKTGGWYYNADYTDFSGAMRGMRRALMSAKWPQT